MKMEIKLKKLTMKNKYFVRILLKEELKNIDYEKNKEAQFQRDHFDIEEELN